MVETNNVVKRRVLFGLGEARVICIFIIYLSQRNSLTIYAQQSLYSEEKSTEGLTFGQPIPLYLTFWKKETFPSGETSRMICFEPLTNKGK